MYIYKYNSTFSTLN